MIRRAPTDRQVLLRRLARLLPGLSLVCLLAACGSSQTRQAAHHHYSPGRYYPPPGPVSDPWGPYIREASQRFGVPEQWVRAVMHQESGGQEDVISWAGAMGLMQVMPETYDNLRSRYNLGNDPFNPHNNILAGTAYLREMYDRYGSPSFLAAYNAGPHRLERYLNEGTPLPEETVGYVASIGPRLGPGTPMSGPLAVYAGGGGSYGGGGMRLAAARTPGGCDPDAAYDPDRPCAPARAPQTQLAVLRSTAVPTSAYCDPDAAYDPDRPCTPALAPQPQLAVLRPGGMPTPANCDPDAAYDPGQPCKPRPEPLREAALPDSRPQPYSAAMPVPPRTYGVPTAGSFIANPLPPPRYAAESPLPHSRYFSASRSRPIQESMAQPTAYRSAAAPRFPPIPPLAPQPQWRIQVGAYPTLSAAEAAANRARAVSPELLRMTKTELPPTTPLGNKVAFRARLAGLTRGAAADACARLSGQGLPCITLPPSAL